MAAPVPLEAPRMSAQRCSWPTASGDIVSRHLRHPDLPCRPRAVQQLLHGSLDALVQAQESRAVVERDPPVAPGIDGLADELAHADGEGWREGIGSERTEAEPGQPGPVAGEAEPSPEPIRIVQPDVGI